MYNSQAYTLSSVQKEAPPFVPIGRREGHYLLRPWCLFLYRGSDTSTEGGDQIAVAEAIVYASDIDPELILTQVRQRIGSLLSGIAV